MSRSRLTDPTRIENQWGKPLGKQAARTPSGLYGYPKQIQSSCEASVRKLRKAALKIVKAAYQKDAKIAEFLTTHAKRNRSMPAKVLLATLNEARPVFGKFGVEGGKTAAGGRYGLYGYSSRTASLGVQACAQFREAAGHIASDLHRRKAAKYARITGFFTDHWKQGKCGYSRMLNASYPDEAMRLASSEPAEEAGQARNASSPSTVAGWLGDATKTAGSYLTVVPMFDRDYTSKAQVMQAWNEGKDFRVNDMSSRWDDKPMNKQDAEADGSLRAVNIRYNKLRKVVVINL
jgi:hypothetical protein